MNTQRNLCGKYNNMKYIFAMISLIFFAFAYYKADFQEDPTTAWILNLGWAIFLGLFLYLDSKDKK